MPGVTTVADGAAELLVPALSPRTADVTGQYFTGQQPTPPSADAQDTDAAQQLWAYSVDVLDVDAPFETVEP